MIQNTHVARHDLVFQNSAGWNIDPVAVICNDDNCALFACNIEIRLDSIGLWLISFTISKMIITLNETPRPNVTSPETVK